MSHAIVVRELGGPEVLRWEAHETGHPGPGEIRLRHSAIGLNFIDVYYRTGLYKTALPFVPGMEGAGVVEEIGAGVTEFAPGDRVAYAGPMGGYAETRLMPAERAIPLPEAVDDRTAAAMMLQGMTARYLIRETYKIKSGETILVHAAAGGVGLILCQWAASLGVTVIGTVSTDEKAALASSHGCHHPIVTSRDDFLPRVLDLTEGKKLPVVYDSIGRDTFQRSLDCLQPRGLLVLFGQSSGAVPPFDLGGLSQKGSLYITRPTMHSYVSTRADLLASAQDLFDVVAAGTVKIAVNQTFPLRNAADAHRALEARQTTGSTVLTV